MGIEVAPSGTADGNGEVRVKGCSDQKLRNHNSGSHGADETAKANGVTGLNAKDASTDESPAEQKRHSFYIVRYRPYDKPNLKAKIDQADKEIWKRNYQRAQILDRIKAKRLDQAQIIEELRSLGREHRHYLTVADEKLSQMIKRLKDSLGSLRNSNIGRNKIQRLTYRQQYQAIPVSEEEQLMLSRDKVIAESMRQKIQLIGTDRHGVKMQPEAVNSRIKQLEDKLKLIDAEISSLQLELTSILEKRDKAVETIYEFRKQRDRKNACFFKNRTLLNNARDLAAEKNIEALKELACSEVEKFMTSWNSSRSFRDDYERRILPSLDFRQLSRDGRIRNPDEKPVFLVQQTNNPAEAQTMAKQDPEPLKKEENINIPDKEDSERKEEGCKQNNAEDDDDEYYIAELPKKEIEIDEATLKELKKQEEMEKQRQAMERKKRQAEKAAAKAAMRAQKEAEKKQKEREKKLKKKESINAVEAEKVKKGEEDVKPPKNVTAKTEESNAVSARYRGQTRGCDSSVPKAILRRKRSNKYMIWVAVYALLLGVFLAILFN